MTQKTKFNAGYIFLISMVSALGGLLFGYDWVVIGGAKPFYEQFFNISSLPELQGWAMSSALVGCLLGAMLSGVLSDRYGRKRLLIFSAFLFTLSAVGTGAVNNFNLFIMYRILGGIGIGLASNLSPMYIAEISPATIRGKYVSLNQLTIVIGILAAQIINWQIADPVPMDATNASILASWNGQMGWRWMFWAEVIPAVSFFIFMFFIPESPRWLAKNGSEDKVEAILSKIGGSEYSKKEYQNFCEYKDYIVGSAEVVGLMCLKVFLDGDEVKYNELKPYAEALGSAFQKVNFLRDINADYETLGRMYFPNTDFENFCDIRKAEIVTEINEEFKVALEGIKKLPENSRLGVYVAYCYYEKLLKKIDRTDAKVLLKNRIRIPGYTKGFVFLVAWVKYRFNVI